MKEQQLEKKKKEEALKRAKLGMEELTLIAKGRVREEAKEEYDRYISDLKEATGRSEESLIRDDIETRIIYIIVRIIIHDHLPDWAWIDLFYNGEGHPIERMLGIVSDRIFSERKLSERIFEGHQGYFDRPNAA